MSVSTGQIVTDNTTATPLCSLPAGACSVALVNAGPATAVVGPTPTGGTALLGTGFLLGPGCAPTMFTTPGTGKGGGFSVCVTQNGQTATVSYLLSS